MSPQQSGPTLNLNPLRVWVAEVKVVVVGGTGAPVSRGMMNRTSTFLPLLRSAGHSPPRLDNKPEDRTLQRVMMEGGNDSMLALE